MKFIYNPLSLSLSQVYFFSVDETKRTKKKEKKTRIEKSNKRTFVLSHGINMFSLLGLINEKNKHDIHTHSSEKLIQCVTKKRKKRNDEHARACRTEKQKRKQGKKI
jgi:hypothetical protein